MKIQIIIAIVFGLLTGCTSSNKKINDNVKVLSSADVVWEKLNPARGDKSPQAGTLWGDRKGTPATGFLAKFVNGFSSPPHIHNVSYRAIVIAGLIHNDEPKAANMWMPTGSYWTQPAGEAHITSAKGKTNLILVEIDNGPYLVKPMKMKFDNGERPYNIHASNIIWKDVKNYQMVELWKNKNDIVTGSLIKFKKSINLNLKHSKLVLISGQLAYANQTLNPGSLISVNEPSPVIFSCNTNDCTLYLKSK